MKSNSSKNIYIKVKDHSVSGETFNLVFNEELDMLETSPQPLKENLPSYYESDDYISHTDSRRNLFEKVYHFVKSISLNRKLSLINSLTTESKLLLDIGCGTGDFLQLAQKRGWDVLGIEPDIDARRIANNKTDNSVFDNDKLSSFDDNCFDVITLWHVLEHVPNLEEQIALFHKLLKPNGTLIIAVPNFKSYDANYYGKFWAAYDVPRHLWHFSKKSIFTLMSNIEMKVIRIEPMKFDSFYVSLLSEKYQTGAMNPLRAFWVGFKSNLKAMRSGEYSSLIYIIKKCQK